MSPSWRGNLRRAFGESSSVDKFALAFLNLSNERGQHLLFSKHGSVHKVTWQDTELSLWPVPGSFDAWHTFCSFAAKQSCPDPIYSGTTWKHPYSQSSCCPYKMGRLPVSSRSSLCLLLFQCLPNSLSFIDYSKGKSSGSISSPSGSDVAPRLPRKSTRSAVTSKLVRICPSCPCQLRACNLPST